MGFYPLSTTFSAAAAEDERHAIFQECTARVRITARDECVPAECLHVAGGAFRDGDNDCAAAVDTDTLTGHPSIHLSIDGIPLDLLLMLSIRKRPSRHSID